MPARDDRGTAHGLRSARRWLVGGVLVSVLAAFLAALAVDGEAALGALARVDGTVVAGLLLLSLCNYALRTLRWLVLSRAVGVRVPWAPAALYYLAGFALTVTPGKLGEALRLWLLKQRYGYRYDRTASLLVADRAADAVAMVALCAVGVAGFVEHGGALVAAALVVLVLVLLLVEPRPLLEGVGFAFARLRRWPRRFAQLRRAIRIASALVVSPTFALMLIPSLLGWLAEAVALWWLLDVLGSPIGLVEAVFVFCFAMLAGAAAMLPGGLGGAEAAMLLLLMGLGVPAETALVATLLIRASTLWFAVLIGFAVLPLALRGTHGSAAAVPETVSR